MPCGFNTYKDKTKHQDQTCDPVTMCGPGQYQKDQPWASQNRNCQPCPSGHWQDSANHANTECKPHRQCSVNEDETVPPTSTSDRQCVPAGGDQTPPTVVCPTALGLAAPAGAGSELLVANLAESNFTATDNSGVISTRWYSRSDSSRAKVADPYPVGQVTTVTFAANDTAGNVASCTTEVRILRITAPERRLPNATLGQPFEMDNIDITIEGSQGRVVFEANRAELPVGMTPEITSSLFNGQQLALKLLGRPAAAGNYSFFVRGTDQGGGASGVTAVLNNAAIMLQVHDCDATTCLNGGLCLDSVPQDNAFDCNCSFAGSQYARDPNPPHKCTIPRDLVPPHFQQCPEVVARSVNASAQTTLLVSDLTAGSYQVSEPDVTMRFSRSDQRLLDGDAVFTTPFPAGAVTRVTANVSDAAGNWAWCITQVSVLRASSLDDTHLTGSMQRANQFHLRFQVDGAAQQRDSEISYRLEEVSGSLARGGFTATLETRHDRTDMLLNDSKQFPDSLSLQADKPAPGTYVFRLVVTDSGGAAAVVSGSNFIIDIYDCDHNDKDICGGADAGQCVAGDGLAAQDGQYACACNNGFELANATGKCERPAGELTGPFIRDAKGNVQACREGTTPNAARNGCQISSTLRDQARGCQLRVNDTVGEVLAAQCSATASAQGLAAVLPLLDALDLSDDEPAGDALALLAAAAALNVSAPQLAELSVGPGSGQHVLAELPDLLLALRVAQPQQLVVDMRAVGAQVALPPKVNLHVGRLRVSTASLPWARTPDPNRRSAPAIQGHSACSAVQLANEAGVLEVCSSSNCQTCQPGQYITVNASDGAVGCASCAAGGFFQDGPAWIGTHSHCACRLCGNGTFTPLAGASSPADCAKCPVGTDPTRNAGYRACACLEGFWRRGRFAECTSCAGEPGVRCQGDVRILEPGFWWTFANESARADFLAFTVDLGREEGAMMAGDFAGYFPVPYECVNPAACLGGIDAGCARGYTGVLCAECDAGFFPWLGECKKCPGKTTAWITAVLIVLVLGAVLGFLARQNITVAREMVQNLQPAAASRDTMGARRDSRVGMVFATIKRHAKSILNKAKIMLSYLQVAASVREAFASVTWPSNYRNFLGAFQFMSVNPLAMVMPVCLNAAWTLDAYFDFLLGVALPPAAAVLVALCYLARRPPAGAERRSWAAGCWRTFNFIVFLVYPFICINTFRLLKPCQTICLDVEATDCQTYLDTDYSITCDTDKYRQFRRAAMASAILYAGGIPAVLLVVLWQSKRRGQLPPTEASTPFEIGLAFFYESYKPSRYLWEIPDMVRKLLLTSVVIVVGEDSYTQLVLGVLFAGLALCLHLHLRPYPEVNDAGEPDTSEFWLQAISLTAVAITLLVGIALRGQQSELGSAGDGDEARAAEHDNQGLGIVLIILCVLVFAWLLGLFTLHLRNHLRRRQRANVRPESMATTVNPVYEPHAEPPVPIALFLAQDDTWDGRRNTVVVEGKNQAWLVEHSST